MPDPLSRILCVEDDPDIQTVLRLALEELGGFTVEICSNGHEALRRAPEFRPQLILLDVMMPGMDGPATLAELRRLPATAATPVAFVTAKAQPQELKRYLELGVVGVIRKPFDPDTLPDELTALWAQTTPKDALPQPDSLV
ncbi:MAG: response regulator [Azospirillum sp.]|nr:response regulator [Azospirillum sp.]